MTKIRSFIQSVLLLAALGAVAYSSELRAEDIDIYFENSAGDALPKVLFIIDNSSNVGSTFGGGGCAAYADGTGAPSLGTNTAGGIIQCALVDTISTLPNNTLQVGILAGSANNFATSKGCVGSSGGCLLVPFTTLAKTTGTGAVDTKTPLINFIKSWKKENSGETPTSFPFTVTSAEAGGMMQEAYAYFYARTGLSGRTYGTAHIQGCQKNFIIYIGNTDKSPANETPSGTALTTAGANTIRYGTSGTLADKITKTQVFDPPICPGRIDTAVAASNSNDWSSNWADEWARFLQFKDGGTEAQLGKQNITTYTIGIIDNGSNQCTAAYPALLQSMATVSGGQAYRVGDAGAVKEAVASALNEAQATNSVFSSASLPVSVNAEGSYLNQIFLGMFRPDGTGAPRWLGNLKQYQLVRNNAGTLVMGDVNSRAAINSSTGFLSPNAISFWTYRDDAVLPDSAGGFFANDPKGEPASGFDSADGEVVEKGGVAQQLRKQNLSATFAGASGTTANPRRVYTYCPDQAATCERNLTNALNDFATSNANIVAADFGSSLTVPVESITRTGAVATITTRGAHGFRSGSIVTVRGADQAAYNQTAAVEPVSGFPNKFTMAVRDWPVSPSQGSYTISVPGSGGSKTITSISRAATGGSREIVTVTTADVHGFAVGQLVSVTGNTGADYNRSWTIETVTSNQFTFTVDIAPVSPPRNTYAVAHASTTPLSISGIKADAAGYKVTVTGTHDFHVGETVTIVGVKGGDKDLYNVSHRVTEILSDGKTIRIGVVTGARDVGAGGTIAASSTAQAATISRTTTVVSGATASVGVASQNWFRNGENVIISSTGTNNNESAYAGTFRITCTSPCTTFTIPIAVTPSMGGTGGGVTLADTAQPPVTVGANAFNRNGGTTVTATLPAGSTFANGQTVVISPSGTPQENEAAYVNQWQITCVGASPCSTFTFGPIVLNPPLSATGNMQAFSGNTAPDRDAMIRWLRGEDNHGDELGPTPNPDTITVRPSVHGDVLHSRPLVINYGDSRGIVVFYGSNDGVYRAVNGRQSDPTTNSGVTVPAGGEFWGLILQEHFGLINRYRTNLPEVKYPGTFSSLAEPKTYFVDGPTGVYQKIDDRGVITRAIIYLTMRRGGRFMYAIDVTQPAAPQVLWRISDQAAKSDQPGFGELGLTWSRPRVTLLQNLTTTETVPASGGNPATTRQVPLPVLVFGAGYDEAQDREPPVADTMGRGIFVLNALTGEKIFSASVSCPPSTAACREVADMKYATPADITFVDRDLNGLTDKLYWGDLGGNLWRADVADASVSNWRITKVAALGCNAGECASGTTPRKFFYPPSVLTIRPAGDPTGYDMLSIASGDREHPLRSDLTNSAFLTNDRFFMIKDYGVTVNSTDLNTRNVVPNSLFNATYTAWASGATGYTDAGFYLNFIGTAWNETTNQPDSSMTPTRGEKAVNAPVAVNGQVFFATNQPKQPDGTCAANLGTARAYAVNPFTGAQVQNELKGGGLPPSAVSGLITITGTDSNGNPTSTQEKFCIGCGVSGEQLGGNNSTPCSSALENCNSALPIPKNLKRTYWYKK
ncbi:MAG TPA: hypothetical protein VF522_03020 [Ramlibacter sp.]|uniref:hypothetical protein n=1 Tax=Ramlibacter sp. TaxID=1917967 RepID=UPI002ED5F571